MYTYRTAYMLLCITYKVIYLRCREHLAQSIIIQSSNRSSWKFHVMKLVQCSTYLAYRLKSILLISFLRYCFENLEFTAI